MDTEIFNFNNNCGFVFSDLGFKKNTQEDTGFVYLRKEDDTCIIIDTVICELNTHPYISYTSKQNQLMATHSRVFRFLYDQDFSGDDFHKYIQMFLDGEADPEKIRCYGGNRAEQEPDPTPPEDIFEDCFFQAFGEKSRMGLHREFAYIDFEGIRRFVDYAAFSKTAKFAIELNGESFHHPYVIKSKRYRSQLLKQNSLVADGFKVFRWSMNGMKDRERFILELTEFMGHGLPFIDKSVLKLSRKPFVLKSHQHQALAQIEKARQKQQYTFLLVLPTGTGKTEVFINDIVRLKKKNLKLKALVLVPTRKLRKQTLARLKLRLPHVFQNCVSSDVLGNNSDDIFVQTSAFMQRHYYKISSDHFDYIVVDEAHHAAAQGLRSILEHFVPSHLLGVTATPERFDQKSLETVFGEFESQLSLEDAIQQGLIPPVRCYRVKSNIDLSDVRFNGKEFVKTDLQKVLRVPSRDQLVADILNRYFQGEFSNKQGVVFCVDIDHANRMTDVLNKNGIMAVAVSGKDHRKAAAAQEDYDKGLIRFLCACDLLTEGWDAPQTSILVMARPTFSKVLYTQQIGRGLRNHPGKEALYVIDVVDNYDANLLPMSLHSLFQIPEYTPFENIIDPDRRKKEIEITILDGLYEGERRIEPVNILSFEKMYGSFLNEEQLARSLFVSTGTIKSWLRKGKISSDVQYPFGRKNLHFFDPDQVEKIRVQMGLKEHNNETRVADYHDFLEKRDYTFSYKIIFMLSFLKICNERCEAHLPELLNIYQRFYENLLIKHGKNERKNCPYNRQEYVQNLQLIQQNILANPFEKFERKRFFYHCKDLDYIAMDLVLVNNLTAEDYANIIEQMVKDLTDYYKKLEIPIIENDYSFLLPEKDQKESSALFVEQPEEIEKYSSVLPFYPLDIAAGMFSDSHAPPEPESWFMVEDRTGRKNFSPSMFVAKVEGKSMEPVIPDGSFCLFTTNVGGSRNGRIVLAQQSDIIDPDTGFGYTVKKYHSIKKENQNSGWKHEVITLKPANPEYQDIIIPPDSGEDFRIIAFFMEILPPLPRTTSNT